MEAILLTLMILGLVVIFTIDTIQKRRMFREEDKKLNGHTYPGHK